MTADSDLLLELMRQSLRVIREVEQQRQEARAMEWQASPATRAEGQRQGQALHSDPTGIVATDDRRIAVREALKRAEADLFLARNHLLAAKARLERSTAAWRG